MTKLEDLLRQFYGLPPHNTWSNMNYGDGHFYNHIKSKYKKEDIDAIEKKLKGESCRI